MKKIMKRPVLLIFTALMILMLCSCGKEKDDTEYNETTVNQITKNVVALMQNSVNPSMAEKIAKADEEDLDDDDADDNDSLSISTKLAAAKDSLGLVLLDKLQTSSFLHEEQSQVVPAGVYRVTIYALANDRGAYVYVTGDSLKQMSPVSAGSCRSLVDALEQSSTVPSLDQLLPKVIIDSIKISRPQNLHYGITTRTSITGKPSHCQHLLYASHFNLERIAGYQTRRTMKKK